MFVLLLDCFILEKFIDWEYIMYIFGKIFGVFFGFLFGGFFGVIFGIFFGY